MLTEKDILEAVSESKPGETVSRETILAALLSEDEADIIVSLRRERESEALDWDEVKAASRRQ